MSFLVWMIFGAVVGVVGQASDARARPGRLLHDYILGIAGALLGGFSGGPSASTARAILSAL